MFNVSKTKHLQTDSKCLPQPRNDFVVVPTDLFRRFRCFYCMSKYFRLCYMDDHEKRESWQKNDNFKLEEI